MELPLWELPKPAWALELLLKIATKAHVLGITTKKVTKALELLVTTHSLHWIDNKGIELQFGMNVIKLY